MINRYCTWGLNVHLCQYLAEFFLEWEIFQTKVVEKIKTYILFNKFVSKNCAMYEIMWKNMVQQGGSQMNIVQQKNMWFACRINKAEYPPPSPPNSHTHTHTHTRAIQRTFCFSAARIVTCTCLSVTLLCILPVAFYVRYLAVPSLARIM